jgi:hypothetical protein
MVELFEMIGIRHYIIDRTDRNNRTGRNDRTDRIGRTDRTSTTRRTGRTEILCSVLYFLASL